MELRVARWWQEVASVTTSRMASYPPQQDLKTWVNFSSSCLKNKPLPYLSFEGRLSMLLTRSPLQVWDLTVPKSPTLSKEGSNQLYVGQSYALTAECSLGTIFQRHQHCQVAVLVMTVSWKTWWICHSPYESFYFSFLFLISLIHYALFICY